MIKTTAEIDGMMCGMCESHVNDVIRKNFAVKKVTSSHSKGTSIILSEEPISEEKLNGALEKIGYKLMGIKSEPYEKKGFFARFKK